MHNHESSFRSGLRPEHMPAAFRQLAAEKRGRSRGRTSAGLRAWDEGEEGTGDR